MWGGSYSTVLFFYTWKNRVPCKIKWKNRFIGTWVPVLIDQSIIPYVHHCTPQMLTIKKWVVSRKKNINTRRRRFLNRESTVYFVYKKIQYDTAFSIYKTVPGRIPTWYNTRLYYSSYSLILDYYDRLVTRIPGITISLWYLQNKNHPFFVLVIF